MNNIKQKLRKIISIRNNQLLRDKWVKKELLNIEKGKKILDAGCGNQIYREFCNHLIYKGQDFGEYDGKGSGDGLQREDWEYGKLDYLGDIWNIEEADEMFDVILCTEVLEHIPYPNETLKEFARLLKPGGVLLLTAPFLSLPHMQPYYFYSGFSMEYYNYFLPKNGFEEISIDRNGDAFEFVAQEMLRSKQFVSNPFLKRMYSLLIYSFMIPILKYFSKKDTGSYKLAVFGYHVKAMKKV